MPNVAGGNVTPLVVPQSGLTGVASRIAQAARWVITGVGPDTWFGPMQPVPPVAPPEVKGRQYDYPTGANLNYNPRSTEEIGFAALRGLAQGCDILRLVIETRKDQMEAKVWTIRPRIDESTGKPMKGNKQEERIRAIKEFLKKPDGHLNWSQWQRAVLEDLFVIDAATIWKRRTLGGGLFQLELIDGATIKPLIGADGRPPTAPDPAYQQILHGVVAADFSAEELVYAPRNLRTYKLYGFSPVEQIILTVNTQIRRALHQLDYYREGSLPDAVVGLPKEMTTDQIKAFQDYFDTMLAGNLAARRRLRAVPGEFKFQELKQPALTSEMDEWLARIICFAFSIAPEPFVKMINRATGETQQARALTEGLQPTMNWMKNSVMDPIIQYDLQSPDLEFAYVEENAIAPEKQAVVSVQLAEKGLSSIDEQREKLGMQPLGGVYAQPMVMTANGYVPVDPIERQRQADEAADRAMERQAKLAPEEPEDKNPTADEDEEVAEETVVKLRRQHGLSKKSRIVPMPSRTRPAPRKFEKNLRAKITKTFRLLAPRVATQVREALEKLGKAKSTGKKIADKLDLSALTILAANSTEDLAGAAADASQATLARLGVSVRTDLVDQVNENAIDFARERAAELVGKRILKNGDIVDNPNAKYRIDETTRDQLRTIIDAGLEEGLGSQAIADLIEEAGAFSVERAELIARTEIGNANSEGALEGYRAAAKIGVKTKKIWIVDGNPCDVCIANGEAGAIDLDDAFPSGDEAPLAHPNCECVLAAVVTETEEE